MILTNHYRKTTALFMKEKDLVNILAATNPASIFVRSMTNPGTKKPHVSDTLRLKVVLIVFVDWENTYSKNIRRNNNAKTNGHRR
jgi:hypothetical protein